MELLGDFYFFGVVIVLAIPAIILGIKEKNSKYYGFLITLLFVGIAFKKNWLALGYLVGFSIVEFLFCKLYLKLRDKYGRKSKIYTIFLILAILPLIINKISGLISVGILGFLGISYMTFKIVQIVIEIYDGVIHEINCFNFMYLLLFFPTITSGPIDRSRRFDNNINNIIPRFEYLDMVGNGLFKICLGMLYKFVIASALYQIMAFFGMERTIGSLIIYMYAYGFYLFFDFAGYSLMAIGVSYLFGVKIPENFNKPFISIDIKEFWDRWHITLSHWFRDFVFTRIMMRFIKKKRFKNRLTGASCAFIINMGIMGLWHGLTSYYIAYGLYHGILLAVCEIYEKKCKFYKKHKKQKWYKVLSWFITFNLVMFGFLIFSGRINTLLKINY